MEDFKYIIEREVTAYQLVTHKLIATSNNNIANLQELYDKALEIYTDDQEEFRRQGAFEDMISVQKNKATEKGKLRKLMTFAADKLCQAVIDWQAQLRSDQNECCQRVWAYHRIEPIVKENCSDGQKAMLDQFCDAKMRGDHPINSEEE